uniref:HMG box domain-containing protein n=1 Tax=Rhabditophanes sp. KR3021 TaxID=114890 RepID=A0AC35TM95_9BILA
MKSTKRQAKETPFKKQTSVSSESEHEDVEEAKGIHGIKIPVSDLLNICKHITEDSGFENKKGSVKLGSVKQNWESISQGTVAEIDSSFKAAFRTACKKEHVPLKVMASMIESVFSSNSYPQLLPDWPKKNPSAFQTFLSLKGITNHFTIIPDSVKAEFNDEKNENKQKALSLYKDACHEYNLVLEDFIKAHPEFSSEQIEFTKTHLVDLNKDKSKSKSRIVANKRKSAFDFFKLTKKGKYTDLTDEERDAKLAKAFKKIGTDQKAIFSALEENQ